MLPAAVDTPVRRYLRIADRLLPGRIVGFYLVGSVALRAFRPGHSDIDFVAVVDGDLDGRELRRLRAVHVASGVCTATPALARGRLALPGTCNGVYVRAGDLARPVSTIVPLASHTGAQLSVGRGFDVNPVQWATFAARGVAVRGAEPATLGLDPQPELLRQWTRDNLASYWVPWAEATRRRPSLAFRATPRWATAWGALGAPRMHRTIASGEVISKEAAGEYAREQFDPRWHPVVDEALAYWRDEPADPQFRAVAVRSRATAEFVLEVAGSAARL
jgi:hypothetical protein